MLLKPWEGGPRQPHHRFRQLGPVGPRRGNYSNSHAHQAKIHVLMFSLSEAAVMGYGVVSRNRVMGELYIASCLDHCMIEATQNNQIGLYILFFVCTFSVVRWTYSFNILLTPKVYDIISIILKSLKSKLIRSHALNVKAVTNCHLECPSVNAYQPHHQMEQKRILQ